MSNPGYNDGGVRHGTRRVQIYYQDANLDGNGASTWTNLKGVYVLENFSTSRSSTTEDRKDEVNEPNGSFGVANPVTGSAVAQFAKNTTPSIKIGDAFSTHVDPNDVNVPGVEGFVITDAGDSETQGAIVKMSISFKKLYGNPTANIAPNNPPVYSGGS